MKRKIAFKTLGCRLNQFETNALATEFKENGYEIVGFREKADIYVINTCTVTNQSDHKSRNIISQAARRGHAPVVVVTGCMAENREKELKDQENISYVINNRNKSRLFSLLEAHLNNKEGNLSNPDSEKGHFSYTLPDKDFRTRGMVKIQDGCDNFCSFCIIPYVRGRAISRPPDDILNNVKQLIQMGFHEIVVTGVNIGRYNYKDIRFEQIIKKILDVPGHFRLRISSMEPEGIENEFTDLIKHPKFCPHLHLCLQSGSDKILSKMHRMYDIRSFYDIVDKIRSVKPGFNFTTDIMVGFPGETKREFSETCNVIKDIGFGHIHTFKYSIRDGTRAARMEDQIPETIKNERSQMVRDLSNQLKYKYRKSFENKIQKVLVERKNKDGFFTGYGEHYIPVHFYSECAHKDTVSNILITNISEDAEHRVTGIPV